MLNEREKLLPMLVIFLMITVSSVGYVVNAQSVEKIQIDELDLMPFGTSIIIPDDFPTIQEGIDNSNPGDVIFVRSGVYNENIIINKEGLYLLGENKFNTVIDIENMADDAVVISADGVTFQNFTVINARNEDGVIWDQCGVKIFSSNVTILDSIISYNRLGLMAYTTAYNLTICDNWFFEDGILIGNYFGADKILVDSVIHDISGNTVNGRPLYYYKNIHNDTVETDAGQIILVNCSNITIKDMYLTNTDFAILLIHCSNCVIEDSIVKDTEGEIILFISDNNTVQNNTAINNMHGVCLDYESKNNIVRYNEVFENDVGISVITSACNNEIYGNKIYDNGWGMKITSYIAGLPSHDNIVYGNEFYDNDIGIRIAATYNDALYSSYNNTIRNNSIINNKWFGIQIIKSEGNNIKNNTFKKNLISAAFFDCKNNYWDHNYWNRARLLPKIIFGYKTMLDKIPIPWLNVDKHPAKQPNEI